MEIKIKKIKRYLLLFTIVLSNFCFGQVNLVQLDDIEGNYDDKNNDLIVPKYDIRFDQDMKLYHNDSLVFTPKGKFNHVVHQIFNSRFWVISASVSSHTAITAELLEKHNIIVIDTKAWDRLYYFDLKYSTILDIYESKEGIGVNAVKLEDIKVFLPEKR